MLMNNNEPIFLLNLQKSNNNKFMNLKLLYLTLSIWVVCAFFKAQGVSGVHSLQVGDKFVKEEVMFKVFPDSKNDRAIWNISDIESLDNAVSVEYRVDSNAKNGIIGIEHNTRYYYIQEDSKLLLKGYENNQTKVVYDMPLLDVATPMDFNFHKESSFHALCAYSEKVHSDIFGQYFYEVDGIGVLVLPSGDSLSNVSRVHIVKYSNQCYQDIAKDSNMVETNIYRWYVLGYRYPVYETIESHVKGNSHRFSVAYYFSPQSQELLNDSENEKIRNMLRLHNAKGTEETNGVSNRVKLADGSVLDYTLKRLTDGNVNMFLSCSKTKDVSLGLYTLGGIALGRKTIKNVGVGKHEWTQNLSKIPLGILLLSITVDGQNFTEKFVNK